MNIKKSDQPDVGKGINGYIGKGINGGVKCYLAIVRKMVQICITLDAHYSKGLLRHVEFVSEGIYQSNGDIHMIELLARFPGPLSTLETLINIRNKGDTFLLFQKALARAYAITSSAQRCQVSINVDMLDFRDGAFLGFVKKMVTKYSINSTNLITFEILENPDSAGIDDSIITILYSLKGLGFKIALDDLAISHIRSGENCDEKRNYSLEYLFQLSHTDILNYLKIDGGTIRYLLSQYPHCSSGLDEFISILQSYHDRGVLIIAEWIQSEYEAIKISEILKVPLLFQGRLLRPGFNPMKVYEGGMLDGPISNLPLD